MSMTGTTRHVKDAGTVGNATANRKRGSGAPGPLPEGAYPVDKLMRAKTARGVALALNDLSLAPVPFLPAGAEYDDADGVTRHAVDRTPNFTNWASYRVFENDLTKTFRNFPEAGIGLKLDKQPNGIRLVELHILVPNAPGITPANPAPEGLTPTLGWACQDGDHSLFIDDGRLDVLDPVVTLADGSTLKIRSVESDTATMAVIPPTPNADGTPREWNACPWIAPLPEWIYGALSGGDDAETPEIHPAATAIPTEGEGRVDHPQDGSAIGAIVDDRVDHSSPDPGL